MKRAVQLALLLAVLFVVCAADPSPSQPPSAEPPSKLQGGSPVSSTTLQNNPDLRLVPTDLRIENSNAGGYTLFIRKTPAIASVLLTESTEDPSHSLASYAMRTKDTNPLNPGEKRMLNGAFLPDTYHFLISSTVIDDKTFGKAFKIYLPYVVEFGYPNGRHGTIDIEDGTFISLRTFALPYADYSGAFQDNPYQLRITQAAPTDLTQGNYNKETITTFSAYAQLSNDKPVFAKEAADIPNSFSKVLAMARQPDVDLVLCLDATGSMEPYTPFVKNDLIPILKKFVVDHPNSRFAYEQFRDYYEDFIYQISPFVTDFAIFQNSLNHYRALAGGDIPEAVDEALYGALTTLDWKAKDRIIVLVGDAPPHPIPRGKITHEMVSAAAHEKNVRILPIVMPTWIPGH